MPNCPLTVDEILQHICDGTIDSISVLEAELCASCNKIGATDKQMLKNAFVDKILESCGNIDPCVIKKPTGHFTSCYQGTSTKVHVESIYCEDGTFDRYVGFIEGTGRIDPLPEVDITECPLTLSINAC